MMEVLLQIMGIGVALVYWTFCVKLGWSLIPNKTTEVINVHYHESSKKTKEQINGVDPKKGGESEI